MHMLDSSTYASSSSSSPWQGLPPDLHHHLMAGPSPAPPPAAATLHHHLRSAAGRRIAKRRPRPSRRLPTTYISADPANFRRMVHQVTGADDLPPPPPSLSPTTELLRPVHAAPAGSVGAGALMMPTLDTSAFLLGRRVGPAARTEAAATPCDGSVALVGGVGNCSNNHSSSGNCGGGFPTLDSWDFCKSYYLSVSDSAWL